MSVTINVPISLIGVSSGNIDIEPNSHYKVDYILYHFQNEIVKLLKSKAKIAENVKFIELIEKLDKLIVNITNSRENAAGDNNYAPPTHNNSYPLGNKTTYANAVSNPNLLQKLQSNNQYYLMNFQEIQPITDTRDNPSARLIKTDGSVDYLTNFSILNNPFYGNNWAWSGKIGFTNNAEENEFPLNFYFHHWEPTEGVKLATEIKEIDNMIADLRAEIPTIDDNDIVDENIRTLLSIRDKDTQNILAQIRDEMQNDDYESMISGIQILLRDLILPETNKLSDLLTVENDVVQSMPNASDYYENIFDRAHLEPAIVKPANEKEVVKRSKIADELEQELQRDEETGYTSNLLLNILGKKTVNKTSEILRNLKLFNKKINEKSGIPDNSILKKIMYSTIIDDNGDLKATYLDESARATREINKKNKETRYLNSIFLPADRSADYAVNKGDGWVTIAADPSQPYEITIGSETFSSDKTISSIYNDKYDYIQRGGSSDIEYFINSSKEMKEIVEEINKTSFNKINNNFYRSIEDRNTYLVEMINVLMISNRLIESDAIKYTTFNNILSNYIRDFKSELKTIWTILDSKVSVNGEIINDMIARGNVLTSQIKNQLQESGFVKPVEYLSNPIINRLGLFNTIRSFSRENNMSYADISNVIKRIYTDSVDISMNTGSVRDIYKRMKSYYANLKSFQTKLDQMYSSISSENSNIENIINGIGIILNENISTVNMYIDNLIRLINSLDTQITNLNAIRTIKNNIKIRREKLQDKLISTQSALIPFKSLTGDGNQSLKNLTINLDAVIKNTVACSKNLEPYALISNKIADISRVNQQIIYKTRFIKLYGNWPKEFLQPKKNIIDNLKKIYTNLNNINWLESEFQNLLIPGYLIDYINNYVTNIKNVDTQSVVKFKNTLIEQFGITNDELSNMVETDYNKFIASSYVRTYDLIRSTVVELLNSTIVNEIPSLFNQTNALQNELNTAEFDFVSVRNYLSDQQIESANKFVADLANIKTNLATLANSSHISSYAEKVLLNIPSIKNKLSTNKIKLTKPIDIRISTNIRPVNFGTFQSKSYNKNIAINRSVNKNAGSDITVADITNLEIIFNLIKYISDNYFEIIRLESLRNSISDYTNTSADKHKNLYQEFYKFFLQIKTNNNIKFIHEFIPILNDINNIYDVMVGVPNNMAGYEKTVREYMGQIELSISAIKQIFEQIILNISINSDLNDVIDILNNTNYDIANISKTLTKITNELDGILNLFTAEISSRLIELNTKKDNYVIKKDPFIDIAQKSNANTFELTTSDTQRDEYDISASGEQAIGFVTLFTDSEIRSNIYQLRQLNDTYNLIISNENNFLSDIDISIKSITSATKTYEKVYSVISKVMFDNIFKSRPFISNRTLFKQYNDTYENYKTLSGKFNDKVISLIKRYNKLKLFKGQINAYSAFSMALDRKIGNEKLFDERNIYLKMSFGLINFYRQTINSILEYLDNQDHSEMCQVHKYLFETHYISLKRISKLFEWIYQYQLSILERESVRPPANNSDRILLKRIDLMKTQGNIRKIFTEFNNIRYLLDDYRSTLMNKVTMHMRINDFKYNKQTPIDLDIPDPKTSNYNLRNLPFNVDSLTNKLIINYNKIPFDADPIIAANKLAKLKESTPGLQNIINENGGIKFDNVYDIKNFPNADIISNYMSLATNIKNGKGVAIMTYGYSGVGKTATIFGKADPDPNIRMIGLLQSTLEEFNSKIKLRVYEMYGLGTQYNFYWNPAETDFPDIYQVLIHHKLDNKNSRKLSSTEYIPIGNRADILSYISELQGPGDVDYRPKIKDPIYHNKLYQNISNGILTESTYVDVKRDQYMNFSDLITAIDYKRKNKGIDTQIYFLGNTGNKQIKATVNNPESSRSIVIYEFQIESESEPGKFTPFVIYDLPGKEDLYKTYIMPNTMPSNISTDSKINTDTIQIDVKEEKSAYVLNPLLVPIFNNNYENGIYVMKQLDPSEETRSDGTKYTKQLVTDRFRRKIISEILRTEITLNKLITDNTAASLDAIHSNKQIGNFYKNSIDKFADLFDANNISDMFRNNGQISAWHITYEYGLLAADAANNLRNADGTPVKPEYIIYITVLMAAIKVLLKNRLFDVVVAMIRGVTNWSFDQIYMFFEAYYINENVLGLLDYLVREIVQVDRSFTPQENKSESEVISENLTKANNYLYAANMKNNQNTLPINYDFYKIDQNNLSSTDDSVKELIAYIKTKYNLTNADGTYGKKDRALTQSMLYEPSRVDLLLHNKSSYDSNKLFRNSQINHDANYTYLNPHTMKLEPVKNTPFIYDILMPYKSKLEYYYLFYVVSNVKSELKAEEQIKLLDNSTPFISALYDSRLNSNPADALACRNNLNLQSNQTDNIPLNKSDLSKNISTNLVLDYTGLLPVPNQIFSGGKYQLTDPVNGPFMNIADLKQDPMLSEYAARIVKPDISTIPQLLIPNNNGIPNVNSLPQMKTYKAFNNIGNSCFYGSGIHFLQAMADVLNIPNNSTSQLDRVISGSVDYVGNTDAIRLDDSEYDACVRNMNGQPGQQQDVGEFIQGLFEKYRLDDMTNGNQFKINSNTSIYYAGDGSLISNKNEKQYEMKLTDLSGSDVEHMILNSHITLTELFDYKKDGKDNIFAYNVSHYSDPLDYVIFRVSPPITGQQYPDISNKKINVTINLNGDIYMLISAIYFIGQIIGSGHYTSILFNKSENNKLLYYYYDDAKVQNIEIDLDDKYLPTGTGVNPYMLLYKKLN